MTFERKRAILIISAALVIGIIIGILATGMLARHHYRGDRNREERNRSSKEYRGRQGFAAKIYDITNADSTQIINMRPVIHQTMANIDTLQKHTDHRVKAEIDSMIVNLQPFLSLEQIKTLDEFLNKMPDHSKRLKRHR